MFRAIRVGLLGAGLVLLSAQPAAAAFGSVDSAPAPRAPLGLSITSPGTTFAAGDAFALTFTVTNHADRPCSVAALPEGTVRVAAARRDGSSLVPSLGRFYSLRGLGEAIRSRTATLPAGGTMSFQVPVDVTTPADSGGGLTTVDLLPGGNGISSSWAVVGPGSYELSAAYRMPQLRGIDDACQGESDVVTVAYAVSAPESDGSGSWPRIGIAVAVAVLLAGALALVLRRRRGPGAGVGGAAALLVLALTVGGSPPAEARLLQPPKSDPAFSSAFSTCLGLFLSAGGDPAGIMPTILDPDKPTVFMVPSTGETDTKGSGKQPGPSVVFWNPTDTSRFRDENVNLDPCSSLYHELYHAYENSTNQSDDSDCGSTGIPEDEVEATFAENAFRAWRTASEKGTKGARTYPQRKTYDGAKLPKSLEECKKKPPDNRPGRGSKAPCNGVAKACGGSNGDPHLTTFDGRRYDLQSVGEYVAVRSTGPGTPELQVRQEALGSSRTVSVNTVVAARLGADRVVVRLQGSGLAVRLNGAEVSMDRGDRRLPGGGTLTRAESSTSFGGQDAFIVRWPDGSAAWLDPIGPYGIRLYALMDPAHAGRSTGLLGDGNGKPDDDLRPRDRSPLPETATFDQIHRAFGDSWRVMPAESLFDYGPGESTATFTDRSFPDREVSVETLSPETRDQAAAVCAAAGVTDPDALRDCVLDVGVSGISEFALSARGTQDAVPSRGSSRSLLPGSGTTVTIDQPQGSARVTFPGTAGAKVFVDVPSADLPSTCGVLTLRGPDDAVLGSGCVINGKGLIDGTVLPATGTYAVVVDPPGDETGSARIDLIDVTDTSGTLAVDGPEATVSLADPGSVARLTFSATAGQKVFVDVPSSDLPSTCGVLSLRNSKDAVLASGCVIDGAGLIDGTTLPETGTYSVVVDPSERGTGVARVRLTAAPDTSAPIAVNGPEAVAVVARPGVVARLTFDGAAEQRITFDVPSSTLPDLCGVVTLRGPDGAVLASGCVINGVGAAQSAVLPTTGAYTLEVDPPARATGEARVRVRG